MTPEAWAQYKEKVTAPIKYFWETSKIIEIPIGDTGLVRSIEVPNKGQYIKDIK